MIALGTRDQTPSDDIVRLRWSTDLNPARKIQIGRFTQMHPGLDINIDPGLGGDLSKAIVQCVTGTGPDIIDMGNKREMMTFVEAGMLLNLTEYAQKMGFAPDQTYPAIKELLMFEGKQYRFPCNVNANCVIYNKNIFDDHNVPYPSPNWSYDDFIKIAQMIKNNPSKSGEKHLTVAKWVTLEFYQDLLIGHGASQFTPDGLTSMLDSAEAIAAMQFYYDLMYVYKVLPTKAETDAMSSQGGWMGKQGMTSFSIGKAAMIFIGRWYTVQVPNYPNLKGNLGAVVLPHMRDRPSAGAAGCRGAGINVKSPHWKEALKFLQYLASPQYSQLIVRDGDSLPPNPDLARTGSDLVNEIISDPDFHQPFIDAVHNARPLDLSPFFEASLLRLWLQERIDYVEEQILTPQEALKSLSREINQRIRLNLERRQDLQRKYEKVTGRHYDKNWWKTYQKHDNH